MPSRRILVLAAVIAAISVAILFSALYRGQIVETYRRYQTDRFLATISKPGNLSWKYVSLVKAIGRSAVKHNPWNDPLKVNAPYGPRGIYIYLLSSQAKEFPPALRCNCTALNYSRAIVCDEDFIRRVGRYLQDPDVHVPTNSEDDIEEAFLSIMYLKAKALLFWLIAHEVGHVSLGHTAHPVSTPWTLNSMSAFTPIDATMPDLGSLAEISADEYALRTMFDPREISDDGGILFASFMQTIGLLTYHVKYSLGKFVEFNPQGHPPFAARLFNAWAVYKREYTLMPELDSDDEAIIDTFKGIKWKPSSSGINPFCEEGENEASYNYPILPGSADQSVEIMEDLISAWISRDTYRALALLRELKRSLNPEAAEQLEPVFELVTRALRLPVEQKTLQMLDEISSKGLLNTKGDGISEFAQILATASLVSSEGAGEWDGLESKALLQRFDQARANLQHTEGKANITTVGLGNLPIFMLFGERTVGSGVWRNIILDIANSASGPAADELNVYLMDIIFNRKAAAETTSSFDPLHWSLLDTAYVAAFAADYKSLVASSRLRQAEYAVQKKVGKPEEVWALFYEAFSMFAQHDVASPDFTDFVRPVVSFLSNTADGSAAPEGLPPLSTRWSDEFQGRFLNLLGWSLLRQSHYMDALKILSKAEVIEITQACFWIRQGEDCVDNTHPELVSIRDNLAEAYLALGQYEKAATAAAKANIYRNKLAERTGEEKDDVALNVISSHYKILAASLLKSKDKEANDKGHEILEGLNDMLVERLKPRIPSRDMFDVVIDSKVLNLMQFMPQRPDWDKRADVLKAYRGKETQ